MISDVHIDQPLSVNVVGGQLQSARYNDMFDPEHANVVRGNKTYI